MAENNKIKGKYRAAVAKMARSLNRMTEAIVPMGAEPKDPLDPFVQKRKTRNDRTEIVVGTRILFAGVLDVTRDVVGPGGVARQEVSAMQVVAERRSRGDAKGGREQETFHPVKADLTLDKSVELYKRPEGRWGVRGGGTVAASSAWLSEDGFDTLDEAPFQPGFCQVGSRECCVAEVMLKGKSTERSAPVLVERMRGPTVADDHYRLVTADLGRGHEVELVEGAAKADPLVTEVLRRVAERKWQVGQGREIAEMAAINALTAGAPVDTAVAVSDDLLWSAKRNLGGAAAATYAEAGAAAGTAHRAGMSADDAKALARKVVAMAEHLTARPATGAPDIGGPPDPAAYASMMAEGMASVDEWQREVILAANAMANENLATARQDVAGQNRDTLGPDLSAINAAARELFIEKKLQKDILVAVAGEAARDRIEPARKTAEVLTAEAARTRDDLKRLEIRIGQLEVDLQANAPEPPDVVPQARGLPGERGRHSIVAERPDLTHRKYQATQRELRYELAKRDAMLERFAEQRALAQAAGAEVESISDDRASRHAAAVKALLAADAAAPGRQSAALAAAKAASWAMRTSRDEVRAERAAAAAHLAALAGANEDDAEVAGRLMAQYHDAAGRLDDAGGKAAQAAIVQVVTGGAGADPNRQILAAAAATAALDGAKPNVVTAAAMGKAIEAAEIVPRMQADRVPPVFSIVDPDARSVGAGSPVIPAIPAHYEAVESRFDPNKAVATAEWKYAKIREVTDLGLSGSPRHGTTSYIIEVTGPKGRYWADFNWSPNANQLYGEILIKPSGTPDDKIAAQAKTPIAYSGVTSDWGSFEQRANDLKARTDAAFAEVAKLLTSRDDDLSLGHLHYHGEESRHLANLLPYNKTRIEEEIRLFVQGRHSQPMFKDNISKLFIEWANDVEGDRSRKKQIIRHQIDSVIRVVTSTALAGGLGGARVAAAFLAE